MNLKFFKVFFEVKEIHYINYFFNFDVNLTWDCNVGKSVNPGTLWPLKLKKEEGNKK